MRGIAITDISKALDCQTSSSTCAQKRLPLHAQGQILIRRQGLMHHGHMHRGKIKFSSERQTEVRCNHAL